MGLLPCIEGALGTLLQSQKGRDAKLFCGPATPAFASISEPTITVTSPDCGPSGSTFPIAYSAIGADQFPILQWDIGSLGTEVKEYVVIVEDPDAPLPSPIVHGLYYAIAGDVKEFGGEAVNHTGPVIDQGREFRVGKNRRGTVYSGPRPVLGHRVHRYMFDVIALKEKLGEAALSEVPTKEEVAKAMEGKIVGWGRWIGCFERKWE